MRETYNGTIKNLEYNHIFVFGSNTEGRHGAGAALWAHQYAGAKYGQPYGLQGNSWAIITKNLKKTAHPSVSEFDILNQLKTLAFVASHTKDHKYFVAYSGTKPNLNGYTPKEMAKIFSAIDWSENVIFEYTFQKLIDSVQDEQRKNSSRP